MQSNRAFPYPTFIELIRAFAGALDIKYSRKELDDKAYDRLVEPRNVRALVKASIDEPLNKCIGRPGAELVSGAFASMLDDYATLVGQVPADGLERGDMLPLLLNGFFKPHLVNLLNYVQDQVGGPTLVTFLVADSNAVDTVLEWAGKQEPDWQNYWQGLDKEQRDRLSAWRRLGGDIPSSQSIQLLPEACKNGVDAKIDWDRLRLLLLIARGIEALKRNPLLDDFLDNVRLSLWGANAPFDLPASIKALQERQRERVSCCIEDIAKLRHELNPTVSKRDGLQAQLRQSLDRSRQALSAIESGYSRQYWVDWYEARWQLLSGDLEEANRFYRQAFEDCMFRAGDNQKWIIYEALVVAAAQANPDKVFLKHLKNACTAFGYDIPSVSDETPSNKFADTVEPWEIEQWKAQFYRLFPREGFFPGCAVSLSPLRYGPLVVLEPEVSAPNLTSPNKKISVGETWQKTTRQLIQSIEQEDFEAVKALLEAGATVNCFSDADDTPVILALQALNVTNAPFASLDQRFFDLISQYDHRPETINKRTQKKRLLPIILAVESGRPDIVERVLSLGADPNVRGETDEQTALNVCLKYIGYVKQPEKYIRDHQEIDLSAEALDSVRRHTGGAYGHTLEDQRRAIERLNSDPRFTKIRTKGLELLRDRLVKYMPLESMRQIAQMLIDAGADVNAEHRSPLPGYTPLMLAAELDERKLFEHMLVKGGDPGKSYAEPRTGRPIDCWEIARYFNARGVSAVLVDIAPNYTPKRG
ncbi:MAG: ankyrin repeat domain-containing protein [Oceanospirillaceae bacterium]|nr:ankyrin repeat domain-containing protein [Oceanospirillaceae bacterium]